MAKTYDIIKRELEEIGKDIPDFIKTGIPENVKSDRLRSIEERNNQALQDILDFIVSLSEDKTSVLKGFTNPNLSPPDSNYRTGQLYHLLDQETLAVLSLWLYTGVSDIGWWKFPKQTKETSIYYGISETPTVLDGMRIGDYYVQTDDGTSEGNVVKIWLFTDSAVGEKFVDPYGSQGPPGPAGVGEKGQPGRDGGKGDKGDKGENGKDGVTPHIGTNGNWWVGNVDTGVLARASILQTRYDGDIIGLRDGINKTFKIEDPYLPGSLKVYFNGILLTKGNNADFIEVDSGVRGNGAVINRVISSKDKLIFEFEKWG